MKPIGGLSSITLTDIWMAKIGGKGLQTRKGLILQRRVYFGECLNTFAVRDLERIGDFGSRPITLGWNSGAHGDQRPSSELGERLAEQPLFDLRRVS